MVVDDAVVVRSLLGRWIEEEADLRLVGSLRNGREAVDEVERIDPDVVVLDVDMPELDGISALPLLLQKKRDLVVIIASALTRRDAEISLKALSLGAADSVPKPALDPAATADFRRELIEKIRVRLRIDLACQQLARTGNCNRRNFLAELLTGTIGLE